MDFKQFASQGKFLRLKEVGDFIEVVIKIDPFTLVPKPSDKFKDAKTGEPKLVVEYVFEDDDGNEKVFTNGSQSFAQDISRMRVGDRVRIIKVEKDGKGVYKVKKVGNSQNTENEEPDPSQIPF